MDQTVHFLVLQITHTSFTLLVVLLVKFQISDNLKYFRIYFPMEKYNKEKLIEYCIYFII